MNATDTTKTIAIPTVFIPFPSFRMNEFSRPAAKGEMMQKDQVHFRDTDATEPREMCTEAAQSRALSHQLEDMAHLGLLRGQVIARAVRWRNLERDALDDLEAIAVDGDVLRRVVREEADLPDAEVPQDLATDAVVAHVRCEPELLVRGYRVETLLLQLVRAQLVHETDPAAFLKEIEEGSPDCSLLWRPERIQQSHWGTHHGHCEKERELLGVRRAARDTLRHRSYIHTSGRCRCRPRAMYLQACFDQDKVGSQALAISISPSLQHSFSAHLSRPFHPWRATGRARSWRR